MDRGLSRLLLDSPPTQSTSNRVPYAQYKTLKSRRTTRPELFRKFVGRHNRASFPKETA